MSTDRSSHGSCENNYFTPVYCAAPCYCCLCHLLTGVSIDHQFIQFHSYCTKQCKKLNHQTMRHFILYCQFPYFEQGTTCNLMQVQAPGVRYRGLSQMFTADQKRRGLSAHVALKSSHTERMQSRLCSPDPLKYRTSNCCNILFCRESHRVL